MPLRRHLRPCLLTLAAASLLGSCNYLAEKGPLQAVVIGPALKMTDPDTGHPDTASQSLLSATAQGLVSFDGDGQIEPGLAERWVVTNDALSYIFRIRDAAWTNGEPVTTAQVAALLRSHIAATSRNRYAREIPGVESIRPMTAQVVEIRLKQPLPHLLEVLAQPEMALLRKGRGWGPMTAKQDGEALLLQARKLGGAEGETAIVPDMIEPVRITARPAAQALARYVNGQADVVLGGRFTDYPLARAAAIDNNRLFVDPAEGMFGLVFAHDDGIAADAGVRRAISMAIRRQRLTSSLGETRWTPLLSLRPPLEKQERAYAPAQPAYAALDANARLLEARTIIAEATAGLEQKPVLRIALPQGPGADLLFASLRADLRQAGLDAARVGERDAADLRLVDELAPSRDPFWYLRALSCARVPVCSSVADQTLAQAAVSADPATKAALFREAEALLLETAGYIPLAEPLRWSVTSPRSNALRPNPRARHPLNRLVAIPS